MMRYPVWLIYWNHENAENEKWNENYDDESEIVVNVHVELQVSTFCFWFDSYKTASDKKFNEKMQRIHTLVENTNQLMNDIKDYHENSNTQGHTFKLYFDTVIEGKNGKDW